MELRSEQRLKEIKDNHEFRKGEGWEFTTLTEDIDWLIQQAELLERISDTWVAIETNGTSEDADNFYSIVQDILTAEFEEEENE